jgi:hypothetical protein
MIATTACGRVQVTALSTNRPRSGKGHKAAASVAQLQSVCVPCAIEDGICNTRRFAEVINELQPGCFDKPDSTGAS